METEKKIYELVLEPIRFDFQVMLFNSGISGIVYNENQEWVKDKNIGDYVLLVKGPEREDEVLLEITGKTIEENEKYEWAQTAPKTIDTDDELEKKIYESYIERAASSKHFVHLDYAIVRDLEKTEESRKLTLKKATGMI